MAPLSDQELLHSIVQGDGTALEALYERYVALAFSLALQITKNQPLAQEIVQDVFTKVWISPEQYQTERGRFSSWLLTLTRNMAIDALRKQARQHRFSVMPPLMLHERLFDSPDFSADMEHHELAEQVQKSMDALKPEQQELLELTYWKGHTLSEVATMKNLPLGTVKSRLHMILKTLKHHLSTWKEERQ